jgi:hypothetical protein
MISEKPDTPTAHEDNEGIKLQLSSMLLKNSKEQTGLETSSLVGETANLSAKNLDLMESIKQKL